MPEFLAFRLWGPMASWGEVAVGERRSSWPRPSKSAGLGLLAAALGIDRTDDPAHGALDAGYGLATRVERSGRSLRDYHTAQAPKQRRGRSWTTRREELTGPRAQLSTILSDRYYYTDHGALLLLWARAAAPHPLSVLKQALERPRFVLYLGRKCCPLGAPLDPQVIEAPGLVAAFTAYRPDWSAEPEPGPDDPAGAIWFEPPVPGEPPEIDQLSTRRDGVSSRCRWQFTDRREVRARLGKS